MKSDKKQPQNKPIYKTKEKASTGANNPKTKKPVSTFDTQKTTPRKSKTNTKFSSSSTPVKTVKDLLK